MPSDGDYDEMAEQTGWYGSEALFGLMYAFIEPGELILDVGVGTGLTSALFHRAGLRVFGMDISREMLDAVAGKGFAERLTRHDLTAPPYPYDDASVDHVVCAGVISFIPDPGAVFAEAGRIARDGGLFGLVAPDRASGEELGLEVGPEHTGTGSTMTMYRHSAGEVDRMMVDSGFTVFRTLELSAFMDAERSRRIRAKAYVARRRSRA